MTADFWGLFDDFSRNTSIMGQHRYGGAWGWTGAGGGVRMVVAIPREKLNNMH